MNGKLSIKNWATGDRPREKMMANGSRALSDAELLAILIGSGNADESAVELSRRILNSVRNDLNELGKCTTVDLMKFKGIGEAKAVNIIAALELGRRRKETTSPKVVIKSSKDAYLHMQTLLEDLPHEEFWILLLSRSNTLLDQVLISRGGLAGTTVDIRFIMKAAIDKLANSLILCHNHPSGNISASEADRNITMRIKEAATLMDIQVVDHIIVGHKQYFSFADEGML